MTKTPKSVSNKYRRSSKNRSNSSNNIKEYLHKKAHRISIPTEQAETNINNLLPTHTSHATAGREPTLSWERKTAHGKEFPAMLHIREKISPKAMIDSLRSSRTQTHIFENFNGFDPASKYRYYDHSAKGKWQNRIIRGDSARVLAALAAEHLEGEIQTIYFDPPYGINFDSNFHPSMSTERNINRVAGKSNLKLPKDPVTVKAFHDTWERGLDSYLDSLLHRFLIMHTLLKNNGSIFVQIGSNNLHRVSILLDEVFGSDNRISTITFIKSASGTTSSFIPENSDYILWYAKDRDSAKHKYSQLYESLNRKQKLQFMSAYAMVENADKTYAPFTDDLINNPDMLSKSSKIFITNPLTSQGESNTDRSDDYVWNGVSYSCPTDSHWSISKEGLDNLARLNRLYSAGQGLRWKKYEDEIPGRQITNSWSQMLPTNKRYPVQTAEGVIERCILMSTSPGDLVLDPTGGSGITASIAEKWGRRWIVIDSSPVSIAIIRHYMTTRIYDWYLLQDSDEGAHQEKILSGKPLSPPHTNDPSKGFVYERIPKVTAKILGYGKDVPPTLLYNKPLISKGVKRVSGPFTVESESSSHIVSSLSSNILEHINSEFVRRIAIHMSTDGICSLDGSQHLIITNLEIRPTFDGFTHTGFRNDTNEKIAVFIVPDIMPVDNLLIKKAILSAQKAGLHTLVVAAFEFQPLRLDNSYNNFNVIKVSINRTLQQKELDNDKIERALVIVGDPRLRIKKSNQKHTVEVLGYDMFDFVTGNIISGDEKSVDCWMLDTDYDGESFFAKEIHFPNVNSLWSKSLLNKIKTMLGTDLDESKWKSFISLKSAPFISKSGKIAVKIITVTGDEMLLRGSIDELDTCTCS